MKTAMQELIEWTEKYEGKMISADQVLLKAHKLIEKEKWLSIDLIKQTEMFMSAETIDNEIAAMNFEDVYDSYYNQTYNQDRITISETRRSIEGIGLLKKQSEGVEWWWKNQNL